MATYAQQANSGKDSSSNISHNNNSGGSNSGYNNNNNHSSSYSSSNHSNHNNSNSSSSHNNSSNSNNNSSNNHNSSDGSKKEEFRKYLEKSGVLDTLTKVLVGLYEEPERPSNAIEYIKRYMGAPKNVDVEGLKRENEQLRRQLAALSVADNSNNTEPTNTNPTASSNPVSST